MEKVKKIRFKVILGSILWGAVYIASVWMVKTLHPSKGLGIFLSLLPALAFLPFIYFFIKELESLDEVKRRIHLEAVAWAFFLALLLIMTFGLLDFVLVLRREDWGYLSFIYPCCLLFYFLGIFISKRKYN